MREALYLDDEVLIGLDGQYILEEIGFATVHLAHNLVQARRLLSERLIDFAVLDVNLGRNQTSLPLASDLVERGIRFAFVSGYNKDEDITANFAVPFISKPFTMASFQKAVDEALSVDRCAEQGSLGRGVLRTAD